MSYLTTFTNGLTNQTLGMITEHELDIDEISMYFLHDEDGMITDVEEETDMIKSDDCDYQLVRYKDCGKDVIGVVKFYRKHNRTERKLELFSIS